MLKSLLTLQVCLVFAETLLKSKPKWQQDEFMESWQNAVPQVHTRLCWFMNTENSLYNDCIGYQRSCAHIELCLLNSNTAAKMQCWVSNCVVVTTRIPVHEAALCRETTVVLTCFWCKGTASITLVELFESVALLFTRSTSMLVSFCTQGMAPDWNMVKGLALLEDTGGSKHVNLFDVRQLPTEPGARFKAVFRERAQWSWTDLQPYVEDLQASHLYLYLYLDLTLIEFWIWIWIWKWSWNRNQNRNSMPMCVLRCSQDPSWIAGFCNESTVGQTLQNSRAASVYKGSHSDAWRQWLVFSFLKCHTDGWVSFCVTGSWSVFRGAVAEVCQTSAA